MFFGPIQQDLVKVEDMLRSASNTHLSSLEKQLPYDLEDSNGNIAELLLSPYPVIVRSPGDTRLS